MKVNIEVKAMDWVWVVHCCKCGSRMNATKGSSYWCKKCNITVSADDVAKVAKELVGKGYFRSKNVEL